jgi:hypothetical protein
LSNRKVIRATKRKANHGATPAKSARRKPFSKVQFKRALAVARQTNLPLERIVFDAATGNFSLVIGKADAEPPNDLDKWLGKHNAH